jgi:hypothetical protein
MAVERRLKRGLPDISPFFQRGAQTKPVPKLRETTSAPRVSSRAWNVVDLACVGLVSFSPHFRMIEQIRLAEALQGTIEDVFVLLLDPDRVQCAEFERYVAPSAQKSLASNEHIRFSTPAPHIGLGLVPDQAWQEMMRPGAFQVPSPSTSGAQGKKSLALIDASHLRADALKQVKVVQLLNEWILVVTPELDSIQEAYQWLSESFAHNPKLSASLLLAGTGARRDWEFVYERFYTMVSEFLSRDLGFLGWMEHGLGHFNPDFLNRESRGPVQAATQHKLTEVFAHSAKT